MAGQLSIATAASRVHVACTVNAAHLPHAAALVQSLGKAHAKGQIEFHLLHDGTVNDPAQAIFRIAAQQLGIVTQFYQPDAGQLALLPPSGRYPSLIWYRMLLPSMLPTLDRAIYLDADTLVLQSLQLLWAQPLDNYLLAAVAQPPDAISHSRLQQLALPEQTDYFNSGVLLLNLKRMREEGFVQQLAAIGRQRAADFVYPDQDALNLACQGRWQALELRWNCFGSLFMPIDGASRDSPRIKEALRSPAVLHFDGPIFAKPWHYRCMHPMCQHYRDFRNSSPWPLQKLEGKSLAAQLLRHLPLQWQVDFSRLLRRLRLKP